jgi:hypothetical protein
MGRKCAKCPEAHGGAIKAGSEGLSEATPLVSASNQPHRGAMPALFCVHDAQSPQHPLLLIRRMERDTRLAQGLLQLLPERLALEVLLLVGDTGHNIGERKRPTMFGMAGDGAAIAKAISSLLHANEGCRFAQPLATG